MAEGCQRCDRATLEVHVKSCVTVEVRQRYLPLPYLYRTFTVPLPAPASQLYSIPLQYEALSSIMKQRHGPNGPKEPKRHGRRMLEVRQGYVRDRQSTCKIMHNGRGTVEVRQRYGSEVSTSFYLILPLPYLYRTFTVPLPAPASQLYSIPLQYEALSSIMKQRHGPNGPKEPIGT